MVLSKNVSSFLDKTNPFFYSHNKNLACIVQCCCCCDRVYMNIPYVIVFIDLNGDLGPDGPQIILRSNEVPLSDVYMLHPMESHHNRAILNTVLTRMLPLCLLEKLHRTRFGWIFANNSSLQTWQNFHPPKSAYFIFGFKLKLKYSLLLPIYSFGHTYIHFVSSTIPYIYNTHMPSYLQHFWKPHWKSMGPPEISRATGQVRSWAYTHVSEG